MHTHSLWAPEAITSFLPAYVANGVTGLRDMGGSLAILRAVHDSLRHRGSLLPRLFAAGAILDGPKPVDPSISIAVANAADAQSAVDSVIAAGADFVKVYTLLPRDAYFAAVAAAAKAGRTVVGHIPFGVGVTDAVRAGQKSIEHLNDELEPYCTKARPAPCDSLIPLFLRYGTWQTPTLAAIRMKRFAVDTGSESDVRLARIPASLRASWLTERRQKLARGPAYAAANRARFADEMWLVGHLHSAGVRLLAGSDAGIAFVFPGFSLHDELELLVAAGLTPVEALRAATLSAAQFMNATDSLGTIAVGKSADLVLLRSNPLVAISATRDIEAVVLRGRLLRRETLDSLLQFAAHTK